jgi:hypothetical protein
VHGRSAPAITSQPASHRGFEWPTDVRWPPRTHRSTGEHFPPGPPQPTLRLPDRLPHRAGATPLTLAASYAFAGATENEAMCTRVQAMPLGSLADKSAQSVVHAC